MRSCTVDTRDGLVGETEGANESAPDGDLSTECDMECLQFRLNKYLMQGECLAAPAAFLSAALTREPNAATD